MEDAHEDRVQPGLAKIECALDPGSGLRLRRGKNRQRSVSEEAEFDRRKQQGPGRALDLVSCVGLHPGKRDE